jgi:anti-anti-sigma factor
MSGFSIQQSNRSDKPDAGILIVNGEMTIQNAGEIRSALLEAFAGVEVLSLDMTDVTEIDLAGLQLLCAAHRTSTTDKKSFSISGTDNETVKSMIRDAGFDRHTGCVHDIDKTCIWVEGENQWQK